MRFFPGPRPSLASWVDAPDAILVRLAWTPGVLGSQALRSSHGRGALVQAAESRVAEGDERSELALDAAERPRHRARGTASNYSSPTRSSQ